MHYKWYIYIVVGFILAILGYIIWPARVPESPQIPHDLWAVRSIDTMKYSRDLAREKNTSQSFLSVIEEQVGEVAGTGATHIAIATPYEQEFVPFLTSWVSSARAHGLHVWFRGNVAGWEQWFDYSRVTREEHINEVVVFIKANPTLFENGDIFTSCPECENGGPGDPRLTGDVEGHRQFLIDEYKAVSSAFRDIGKNVSINYPSMNYDVATLIMDPATTQALGGVVGIDHYVADPLQIAKDVHTIAEKSGGKVFLSEFGAPIPDLHGKMSEQEQATWIRQSLTELAQLPELIGINYWVGVGGSTQLWDSGQPREAVSVITEFFNKKY